MTQIFPDVSIQNFVGSWWREDKSRDYRRGRLIRAFVPHVNQVPYCLQVSGRTDATQHNSALFEIKPTSINQRNRDKTLPVAALPEYKGESYGIYRTKKRPLLIISSGGDEVPDALRQGKPRWQTAPTVLACPYYGADEGGDRSGFRDVFLERVRRCEYPQFVYDQLPLAGSKESILRLDHLQPIGRHHDSIEFTPHCLTEEALEIVDEWLWWLIEGYPEKDGALIYLREELLKIT